MRDRRRLPGMDQRLGRLVRAVRRRRGLRQLDLARVAGVSDSTISLIERGHWERLSLRTLERVARALDIRVELTPHWRGGDAGRLLNREHSALADSVAAYLMSRAGWVVEPEVSFSIYGERGAVDQLCWYAARMHLLVVELKTEFVDVNEMLGTLHRKIRLARAIAKERGWEPAKVSAWVIVSDTRTNRRYASQHRALLKARLESDGRKLRGFLRDPLDATTGERSCF